MSDIVERLRYLSGSAQDRVLTREAADEIERLRAFKAVSVAQAKRIEELEEEAVELREHINW